MRKRLIGWWVAAAVAALAYAAWPPTNEPSGEAAPGAALSGTDEPARSSVRLGEVPERATIGRPRANLFAARGWASPAPPPSAEKRAVPAAPVLPYKFAGKLVHDGIEQLYLAKGDVVLPVREGDTLDGAYRVESIALDRITLLYLPLGLRETISLGSALAAQAPASTSRAGPTTASTATQAPGTTHEASTAKASQATGPGSAKLRWEGPETVPADGDFDVALRLTSPQPVGALPLQLSFDAKVLQSVAVRPGKFLGQDGRVFGYRVSADGAIFVGASGKGATASDAELLVLTFRPIRSGTTTEVRIAAAKIRGASGRPIAYEQLAAFRTAVGR